MTPNLSDAIFDAVVDIHRTMTGEDEWTVPMRENAEFIGWLHSRGLRYVPDSEMLEIERQYFSARLDSLTARYAA